MLALSSPLHGDWLGKERSNSTSQESERGPFPPSKRALNLVIEWALDHRVELMEDWELCQSKQAPKKIPPLE